MRTALTLALTLSVAAQSLVACGDETIDPGGSAGLYQVGPDLSSPSPAGTPDGGGGGGGPLECTEAADCAGADVAGSDALGACEQVACLTGSCVVAPKPDGFACTDGNPCTEGDACLGGTCEAGEAVCACDSDAECAPFDVDKCDGGLVCTGGQCVPDGEAVVCDQPDDPCVSVTCQAPTGECVGAPADDGTPCDEGDACLAGSTCQAGLCEAGPPPCDDDDPCTADGCDPDVGCIHSPVPDGLPCDDGDACTAGEACVDGACAGGALADGCSCLDDADCADAGLDLCAGTWLCVDGGCKADPGTAPDCSDLAGECTVGTCDPGTGACKAAPVEAGTPCDDGDACTALDACAAGGVCLGLDAPCDDGDPCTADGCDAGTGDCTHVAVAPGSPCDDGDACTDGDSCKAGAGCVGSAVACDDGDACTSDSCDVVAGGCVFAPIDGCGVPLVTCASAEQGSACDDGDDTTLGDVCLGKVCRGFVAYTVAAPAGGELTLTTVDHVDGKWFVVAEATGSTGATAQTIRALDLAGGTLTTYGATATDGAFVGLHGGFALDDDGTIWRYDSSSNSWSDSSSYADAYGYQAAASPRGLWAGKVGAEAQPHLWLVGLTWTDAPHIRVCKPETSPFGEFTVLCVSQSIDVGVVSPLVAIHGTQTCADGSCSVTLTMAGDYPTGGGSFYNDTYDHDDGLTGQWQVGFYDEGPAPMESRDIASLGGERALVVGTGGYLRWRDSEGDWSSVLDISDTQFQRSFEGAWGGLGGVTVAATRPTGPASHDLELWVARSNADLEDSGAWDTILLETAPGAASGLFDVRGANDGTVIAVGRRGDNGRVYVREPGDKP